MAGFTQQVLFFLGHSQLGGKGAVAHAGRISLHDTDGLVQLAAGDASADGCISADGVGGSGVGINAVVDITQGSQLGLKHDLLAGIVSICQVLADIADVSAEHFLEVLAPVPHIVHADRLLVINVDHGQVLGFHQGFQALAHTGIHVDQIAHAQGFLHVLITIGVSNAALGGTKLCARFGKAGLLQAILLHMERHGDGSTVRNFQVVRGNLNTLFAQGGDLFFEMFRVNDHTAAHNTDNAGVQDAGGHQVQYELAALVFDGVAGVVAALVTGNDVIIAAEQVHHTALALVAPVDTGNCSKHEK